MKNRGWRIEDSGWMPEDRNRKSEDIRIALLLRRIGPYHHARFNHAGKELDLHVVETRPASEEYMWKREVAIFDSRFSIRDLSDQSQKENPSQFNYHHYKLEIAPNRERGWRGKELKCRINEVLGKINPGMIITTGWADAEYHSALLYARGRHIPCAVISDSTENDVKRYWILEWIKKQILKNYSAALVAGTRSRKYIEKLGVPPNRVFEAWDVVDNEYFYNNSRKLMEDELLKSKYPLPEKYFLCVSRYIPKKNIPGLIRSFASFKKLNPDNRVSLVLLGSGPLQEQINMEIKNADAEDYVYQLGFIQYDELPYFYANASALILPSFYDQWGLVVNEAMASGCPILVSSGCGCSVDLVEHETNGIIFNPGEIHQTFIYFSQIPNERIILMCRNSLDKIKKFSLAEFTLGLKMTLNQGLITNIYKSCINKFIIKFLLLIR